MEGKLSEKIKYLHEQLHISIETRNTCNSKEIIDQLCAIDISQNNDNDCLLNFYSHEDCLQNPLIHAFVKGNPDVSLLLLNKGCIPLPENTQNDSRCTHERHVFSKWVFKLLDKPEFEPVVHKLLVLTNHIIIGSNGDTILHVICKKKLKNYLNSIFNSHLQSQMLFHFDNQGFLPIHIAARHNFIEFFRFVFPFGSSRSITSLLSKNKDEDLESYSESGHSLYKEMESSSTAEIAKPIRKIVCLNSRVKDKKLTALHIAAKERHPELIEFLILRGADVHACAEGSKTALMECLDIRGDLLVDDEVSQNVHNICTFLVLAGASVNIYSTIPYSQRRSMASDDTVTPLHLAAGHGVNQVVRLLLDNGAEASALSKDMGRIPLHFSVEKGHTECALTLLTSSLYSDQFLTSYVDYAFNTLVHSANRCTGESQLLTRLVRLGCPLDRPNVNNLRPLDKAITNGNLNLIHMLLKQQPHIVNVRLYQGPRVNLPLSLAAIGKLPLCQVLLSYGADIYGKSYGKHMAFRKAFSYGRYENGVYLCEQMSRPFTLFEKDELMSYVNEMTDEELANRLRKRLNSIPSLISISLDAVRKTVIMNKLSFKNLETLPVPLSVINALRYQNSRFEN